MVSPNAAREESPARPPWPRVAVGLVAVIALAGTGAAVTTAVSGYPFNGTTSHSEQAGNTVHYAPDPRAWIAAALCLGVPLGLVTPRMLGAWFAVSALAIFGLATLFSLGIYYLVTAALLGGLLAALRSSRLAKAG